MRKEDLIVYFSEDIEPVQIGESVGMEIETSFIRSDGSPITLTQSQGIFYRLYFAERASDWTKEFGRWHAEKEEKGSQIVKLQDKDGNILTYDLGWQNIELCTVPMSQYNIIAHAQRLLQEIYDLAEAGNAHPYFVPILNSNDDLLIVPDERDQIWVDLDGREALAPLARISSVQFTIAVENADQAIVYLNRLGRMIGYFLENYPQDRIWKGYIRNSRAGYHPLRYRCPLFFRDLEDYCEKLLEHDYVDGSRLVPCSQVENLNIPLFLRSVWWYFRLRRYGNHLCIEVRPLGRYSDNHMKEQLGMVLSIMVREGNNENTRFP